MSDLGGERERLRAAERRVAGALGRLQMQVAGLGPSRAEVLAAELHALHRAPSRPAAAADWGAQVEQAEDALRTATTAARRLRHQRSAARRAAWAQAVGDVGGASVALPEPEPDPRSTGGRAVRHGWVAGLTLGALLLGDGMATMLWQEPLSALSARGAQDHLDGELPSLIRRYDGLADGRAPDFAAAARRLSAHVRPGGALGRIELPSLDADFVVVQGTTTAALEKGPGHYGGTALPGEDGTVGVAGHRTTYLAPFRGLDRLTRGTPVVLDMPYGRFTYRVTRQAVVSPTSAKMLEPSATGQRLVLTTCDPVFSDARRLVVFARLVDARR